MLVGIFQANSTVAFLATTGVVLGAAYMLWLYRRVVFGSVTNPEVSTMKELSGREMVLFVPIILLVIWLGIYPKAYMAAMEPSVAQLIKQVSLNTDDTGIDKK